MNYPQPPGIGPNMPPQRNRTPAWIWVILGGCGCCMLIVPILAAILFPIFAQAREAARQQSCLSNEKQMALAVLEYQQDHDQNLPNAATWMDDIAPYIKDQQSIYHCPDSPAYGYAFNSNYGGTSGTKLSNPSYSTLLYDSSSPDKDASDPVSSLPDPGRHRNNDDIAFADGHVQAMLPSDVPR